MTTHNEEIDVEIRIYWQAAGQRYGGEPCRQLIALVNNVSRCPVGGEALHLEPATVVEADRGAGVGKHGFEIGEESPGVRLDRAMDMVRVQTSAPIQPRTAGGSVGVTSLDDVQPSHLAPMISRPQTTAPS